MSRINDEELVRNIRNATLDIKMHLRGQIELNPAQQKEKILTFFKLRKEAGERGYVKYGLPDIPFGDVEDVDYIDSRVEEMVKLIYELGWKLKDFEMIKSPKIREIVWKLNQNKINARNRVRRPR